MSDSERESGWKYYLPDDGETAEDACRISGKVYHDEDAAEMAAEDIENNRGGWECSWPVKIVVVAPDGTESRFNVEKDYSPFFVAYQETH